MTENTLYGDTNFLHSSVVTTFPVVEITTNLTTPGIDMAPSSITTNSGIMGLHAGYDSTTSSTTMNITNTNSAGTAYNNVLTFYQDGTILAPKYASSQNSVITADSTGKFIALASLPVSMGGTGLTTVPPANTILGSNGTSIIPVTAGTGISIAGGVISATGGGTPSSLTLNTTQVSTAISIAPTTDGGLWVVNYLAPTSGSQAVFNLTVTTGRVISINILSARRAGTVTSTSQLGSATQDFSLYNVANITYYNGFGNNSNTGKNALVYPISNPVSGSTVPFTISLDAGDIWKGIIEIVAV
jgi:hypothetical protein